MRIIPGILAFGLLALQISVPWAGRNFITQDGPSHLYTATLARNVIFGRETLYRLQPALTSNWGTVAAVNAATLFVKPGRLEAVLFGACALLGFLSFAYFRRSLDPLHSPWSPVAVFLTNVWFLWIGFYNFYLGMALCAFILGYHIRHAAKPERKSLTVLSLLLTAAFFVHVAPVGLALLGVALVTVWVHWIAPQLVERPRPAIGQTLRRSWRAVALTSAAAIPAACLLWVFAANAPASPDSGSNVEWAWNIFPMHVFAAARGRVPEHQLLWPVMLFYMAAGLIAMRRREWASARGAIAMLAFCAFGLYLFLPDSGFGGAEVKIRFSWALFIFGCLLAATVGRIRALALPVALYVTFFETASLLDSIEVNSKNVSRAVAAYSSALEVVPKGATVVRLRCPSKALRERFGYDTLASEPLLHADSVAAVKLGFIDLTDYQAIARTFPVAFGPAIPEDRQGRLWDLEGTVPNSSAPALRSILEGFPVPIHYLVVLGSEGDVDGLLDEFASKLRLVSTDPAKSFVRVYQLQARAR